MDVYTTRPPGVRLTFLGLEPIVNVEE